MKFSDISEQEWESLSPWVDTCLLPYTGLNGTEKPWEATAALEKLRDFLDLLEVPYRGRVVTYPAVQYGWGEATPQLLDKLCARLHDGGFRFVVIASIDSSIERAEIPDADLVLAASGDLERDKERVTSAIENLWARTSADKK